MAEIDSQDQQPHETDNASRASRGGVETSLSAATGRPQQGRSPSSSRELTPLKPRLIAKVNQPFQPVNRAVTVDAADKTNATLAPIRPILRPTGQRLQPERSPDLSSLRAAESNDHGVADRPSDSPAKLPALIFRKPASQVAIPQANVSVPPVLTTRPQAQPPTSGSTKSTSSQARAPELPRVSNRSSITEMINARRAASKGGVPGDGGVAQPAMTDIENLESDQIEPDDPPLSMFERLNRAVAATHASSGGERRSNSDSTVSAEVHSKRPSVQAPGTTNRTIERPTDTRSAQVVPARPSSPVQRIQRRTEIVNDLALRREQREPSPGQSQQSDITRPGDQGITRRSVVERPTNQTSRPIEDQRLERPEVRPTTAESSVTVEARSTGTQAPRKLEPTVDRGERHTQLKKELEISDSPEPSVDIPPPIARPTTDAIRRLARRTNDEAKGNPDDFSRPVDEATGPEMDPKGQRRPNGNQLPVSRDERTVQDGRAVKKTAEQAAEVSRLAIKSPEQGQTPQEPAELPTIKRQVHTGEVQGRTESTPAASVAAKPGAIQPRNKVELPAARLDPKHQPPGQRRGTPPVKTVLQRRNLASSGRTPPNEVPSGPKAQLSARGPASTAQPRLIPVQKGEPARNTRGIDQPPSVQRNFGPSSQPKIAVPDDAVRKGSPKRVTLMRKVVQPTLSAFKPSHELTDQSTVPMTEVLVKPVIAVVSRGGVSDVSNSDSAASTPHLPPSQEDAKSIDRTVARRLPSGTQPTTDAGNARMIGDHQVPGPDQLIAPEQPNIGTTKQNRIALRAVTQQTSVEQRQQMPPRPAQMPATPVRRASNPATNTEPRNSPVSRVTTSSQSSMVVQRVLPKKSSGASEPAKKRTQSMTVGTKSPASIPVRQRSSSTPENKASIEKFKPTLTKQVAAAHSDTDFRTIAQSIMAVTGSAGPSDDEIDYRYGKRRSEMNKYELRASYEEDASVLDAWFDTQSPFVENLEREVAEAKKRLEKAKEEAANKKRRASAGSTGLVAGNDEREGSVTDEVVAEIDDEGDGTVTDEGVGESERRGESQRRLSSLIDLEDDEIDDSTGDARLQASSRTEMQSKLDHLVRQHKEHEENYEEDSSMLDAWFHASTSPIKEQHDEAGDKLRQEAEELARKHKLKLPDMTLRKRQQPTPDKTGEEDASHQSQDLAAKQNVSPETSIGQKGKLADTGRFASAGLENLSRDLMPFFRRMLVRERERHLLH